MRERPGQREFYSDQLVDTEIVSPVDGVVVNKALEVGEWVTPGTPILTVDDLTTIWARVDVQETDLGSIYVGKAAQVGLPTNPPAMLSGRIMAIGQEGEFATERDVRRGRQDIRTFYVKVQVLQADGELKPGMTAEVTFPRRDGTATHPQYILRTSLSASALSPRSTSVSFEVRAARSSGCSVPTAPARPRWCGC